MKNIIKIKNMWMKFSFITMKKNYFKKLYKF